MGMVMYLRRASVADLARIGDDAAAAEQFAFPDDYVEDDPGLVDFDKAWQALHFLLTGAPYDSDSPLAIIAGDLPRIGEEQMGQADAWRLAPERLSAFAVALRQVDDETLRQRYDLDAMLADDVHLADAFVGDDEAIDYIMQGVPALRRWADACAAAGDGAVRILA